MKQTRQFIMSACFAAGIFCLAGPAYSAEPTSIEKAELAQLSPATRSQVEARLVSGQTVRGVLETILLNNVSQDYASGKVVATDFQRGDMVEESKSGQIKVFPFNIITLEIKK